MISNPANLFPENLKDVITSTFALQSTQLVIMRMLQPDSIKSNDLAIPSPEAILHPNELETFIGYKLAKRRGEFLTGRYCAKAAVINHFKKNSGRGDELEMRDIEIYAGPDGRPAARTTHHTPLPEPDISIAHSKEYGIAVAAEKICGIDLQESARTLLRVQRRYCIASELQVMENALSKENLLTRLTLLWAAKEAAKKALSFWRMPGFLDLKLTNAKQDYSDSLQLRLRITSPGDSRAPLAVTVSASKYLDYGLAVCFIDKDPSNA